MNKRTSLSTLISMNSLVFISFEISIYLLEATKLDIKFVLFVLVTMSLFETFYFYKKNKLRGSLPNKTVIGIVLKSTFLTIGLIGIILFVIILL